MGMAELLHWSWSTGLVGWATGVVATKEISIVKSALTVVDPKTDGEP